MTAGHVGCAADEIAITESGRSTGWRESSETWIAECKGRRFVCSKTTSGGWSSVLTDTDGEESSAPFQVACEEELEARQN